MSNKLTVLTVATGDEGYLSILKKQFQDDNVNYKIIGYGEKWGGWTWRTDKILEYIRKNHHPDDIIMVVDGYDVLYVGNEKDIMKKYRSFNTDLVFGVELNDSVDYSYISKYVSFPIEKIYFDTDTEYIKNGGSFIGTAGALVKIYERMKAYSKKTGQSDDQLALNNISLKGISYKIDKKGEIFWIWHGNGAIEFTYMLLFNHFPDYIWDLKIDNGRPIFKNGVKPEIVHGVGQRNMTMLLDKDTTFEHKYRDLAQADLYYTMLIIKTLCVILFLIVVYLVYAHYYKDTLCTNSSTNDL
jgi:hypothetical protein